MHLLNWTGQVRRFGKFFAYFIIVNLLATGFIGTLLYMRSSSVLSEETRESNHNTLIQLNKSIDILLNQVDKSLQQMSFDPYISNFMDYYYKKDFPMQMKTTENLNNILVLNSYIHSIDIFYIKEQKVFMVNRGVFDTDDFSDRDIIQRIRNTRPGPLWIPSRKIPDEKTGKEINAITVVKPIPQTSYDPDAYAFINIDEKYLRDIMSSIIKKSELEIYIVNNIRQIISYNANSSSKRYDSLKDANTLDEAFNKKEGNYSGKLGRDRITVSFVTSELDGWKYISIIPNSVITQRIEFIKNYAVTLSLLAILIGMLVSLFFSNRIYKAINGISKLFLNNEALQKEKDPLKYIENSVNRLIEKNRSIESTLENHMPVLRNNFINSILRGHITDKNEINEGLEYYRLNFGSFSSYCVYVVSIDSDRNFSGRYTQKQLNMLVVYLIQTLNELMTEQHAGVAINTKENEIALIVCFDGYGDKDALKQECRVLGSNIHSTVFDSVKYSAAIAMGRIYPDISDISRSYNEAVEALQYKLILGNDSVIFFDEIDIMRKENYNYPFKKEGELLNALKQGDMQSIKKLHEKIVESFILKKQSLPKGSDYYYYMQLLSSIIKSAFEIGMDMETVLGKTNLYEDLLKRKSKIEINEWFMELYSKMVLHIGSKKEKNKDIAETIEAYIMANYDKDLSLHSLSQLVYMSVPYLSKVFRDKKGKSLKQFINEVRMEKAKILLKNPEYKINEVGEKVGYDKVHSFLKLFKEYTGMTPGEYRASRACRKFCVN